MTRSLFTGISGLRTHQQQLDVVANNLANMNTIGFKAQNVNFSDLIYQNLRGGGGSSDPQAVGTGVQVARISRNFTQGSLESTGQIFDFAIQGEGFFTLVGPANEQFYTRDGSFTVSSDGILVDPSTGFTVRRFGELGEPSAGNGGFQVAGEDVIRVPLGAAVAGSPTGNIDFVGNLPAGANPPAFQILESFDPFETSAGAATGATLLDDLTINGTNYGVGDQLQISGTNPDGSSFTGTISAQGATMADLVTGINGLVTGATASLQADGTLRMIADTEGNAAMTLNISDVVGNTGNTSWTSNSFTESQEGNDGDTFQTSLEIYDLRGQTHRLNVEFRKVANNTWTATASIDAGSGSMIDAEVHNITFNEDGSFAAAGDTGVGDADIEITLNSLSAPQTISLGLANLSHLATDYTMIHEPDGFPSGTLVSVAVSAGGEVSGLATNGRSIPLAQLAMARFRNASALDPVGSNMFQQTIGAGIPSIGEGNTGGRGSVVGGQLESSNVDIAQEFTQLIVAQRGFSANARTITVADEMLEELTNIIR